MDRSRIGTIEEGNEDTMGFSCQFCRISMNSFLIGTISSNLDIVSLALGTLSIDLFSPNDNRKF